MATYLLYMALTVGLAAILWVPNVVAIVVTYGFIQPADLGEAA